MTRMISFRVSNDEFELLRSKSESQGARSVSDYARLALCGSPSAPDDQIVHQLSDEIQQLRLEINRLRHTGRSAAILHRSVFDRRKAQRRLK
ncbi:MAG: hypothetical protein DMG59_27425 [Acidobacteria bacterium]|nr:MAG: hypothetical protein DMG59_27425 [Acidobacteriota bacterium]